jgi:23S rRNA (uracil1939-C5)-methyltransferase
MKEQQFRKGQLVELNIASIAPGGEGVSKDLGIPVFVNRAATHDRAEVELFDVRSKFARGKINKILTPSTDRIEPFCKIFKVCGGCQWQHLNYEAQLRAKKDIVKQSLEHIGKLSPDLVQEPIGADASFQFFYRNKVQFPVRQPHKSSRILAGYYQQDSHELVNIKHCPIQPEPLDRMLDAAKQICEQFGITAYEERSHRGLLRFICARISRANNQILITLVMNCEADELTERMRETAQCLLEALPEVVGVCLNFNTARGNKILGDQTICMAGEPYVEEVYKTQLPEYPELLKHGLRFRLSSSSFFQIHTEQATKLLESLSNYLIEFDKQANGKKLSEMTLVDAYSGVGAMSLWLAPFVKKVIAIEENAEATRDGEFNMELNGLTNVEFITGQVEEILPQLRARGHSPDIIVVDPPRKGLPPETIESILQLAPQLLLYVSCNPSTLARDLKLLKAQDNFEAQFGYKTRQVLPIDLFPQTYHVESIAVLDRQLEREL